MIDKLMQTKTLPAIFNKTEELPQSHTIPKDPSSLVIHHPIPQKQLLLPLRYGHQK